MIEVSRTELIEHIQKAQRDLSDRLASLQTGDFLYFHPLDNCGRTAIFGKYFNREDVGESLTDSLLMLYTQYFTKEVCGSKELWLPSNNNPQEMKAVPVESLFVPVKVVYINQEIEEGMRTNGNPNRGLVKAIMDATR